MYIGPGRLVAIVNISIMGVNKGAVRNLQRGGGIHYMLCFVVVGLSEGIYFYGYFLPDIINDISSLVIFKISILLC